jgi:hypothetical protein
MLTAQELAEARADYASAFLTERGRIMRAGTGSKSAYGGRENRLQTVADNVPCRASAPGRTQLSESGSRSVALGDWDVMLPIGIAIAVADEVHIGQSKYEVLGSDEGRVDTLCLTAYCRKQENS